jgi:hypothetical protein
MIRAVGEARSSAQVEIVRRLTPAQKLAAAERLYRSARALKESWLRSQHPDWPPERVRDEVRRRFLLHGE